MTTAAPAAVSPKSRYDSVKADAWKKFQQDTEHHVLKSVREGDGLRCVTIGKPGTGIYGYTLTTWPGYLAVSGDMGEWVFTRLPDMFEFFRGAKGDINPSYWSEKLVAVYRNGSVRDSDLDTLRESLRDHYGDEPDLLQKYLDVIDDVPEDTEGERTAIERLMNLEDAEDDAKRDISIPDAYEFSRSQFSFHFLWICFAIVHGIAIYDAAKKSQPADAPRGARGESA